VFFLLQMLSKTSVDEVFMHHFEKMSSAPEASPLDPDRGAAPEPSWRTPSFRHIHCPPWKKSCGGPW